MLINNKITMRQKQTSNYAINKVYKKVKTGKEMLAQELSKFTHNAVAKLHLQNGSFCGPKWH